MPSYKRPDHWSRKAKEEGYAARSVFKLEELHQRFPVIPRGGKGVCVDLGCFPGSWSKWLLQHGMRVVGVDLKAPDLAGGTWLVASALEVTAAELVAAAGAPIDVLVSDMAPNTTGNRFTDHVRQIALAERALALALEVLGPEGAFVTKVFDGGDAPAFVRKVQTSFHEFKRLKPDATRDQSVEFFVAGRRPKGGAA
jgi:23S rRNA (uridine2552-2'-O)-methyltransferase